MAQGGEDGYETRAVALLLASLVKADEVAIEVKQALDSFMGARDLRLEVVRLQSRCDLLAAAVRLEQTYNDESEKWNDENPDDPMFAGYILPNERFSKLRSECDAARVAALNLLDAKDP